MTETYVFAGSVYFLSNVRQEMTWHTLSRLKLFSSFKDSTPDASSLGGKFSNLCLSGKCTCTFTHSQMPDENAHRMQHPYANIQDNFNSSLLVLRSPIKTLNSCVSLHNLKYIPYVCSEINKNCLPENFQMDQLLWTSTCTPSLNAVTLTFIGHVLLTVTTFVHSPAGRVLHLSLLPTLPQVK